MTGGDEIPFSRDGSSLVLIAIDGPNRLLDGFDSAMALVLRRRYVLRPGCYSSDTDCIMANMGRVEM